MKDTLLDFWRILKGTLYFRFSAILLYAGTSIIFPVLWEYLLKLAIQVVNIMYNDNIEFSIETVEPDLKAYILGGFCILASILNFIYFHKKSIIQANLKENESLECIYAFWKDARDLNSDEVNYNQDDVIDAVNLLNRSGDSLKDKSSKALVKFDEKLGKDFKVLYDKIEKFNYKTKDGLAKDLLKSEAHELYQKLNYG